MALKSYKSMLEQQMIEIDYKSFENFLIVMETGFGDKDLQVVYELHAKYFNHNFNIPCGCGGAKKIDVINNWISDLKKVFANGIQTKEL